MNTRDQRPIAAAEAPEALGVYRIWPGGGRPAGADEGARGEQTMVAPWAAETGRRMVRNVVVPTITHFGPAPGTANGTALVIAPGGAFHFLMIDHEGYDLARTLAARGVTCFVLKYRVMPTPERDEDMLAFRNDLHLRIRAARQHHAPGNAPLTVEARQWGEDDGRQAIRFIRERAAEFGIDPARIGIAGFSAGGGVAMGATLEHDDTTRPDFACAIYPALRDKVPVPADAPPLFMAISDDDQSVPPAATARLYAAWREAGIPAELHVFGNGGHGWGMGTNGHLADAWFGLFSNWLEMRGLIAARG